VMRSGATEQSAIDIEKDQSFGGHKRHVFQYTGAT
jgi:hypothetical protein